MDVLLSTNHSIALVTSRVLLLTLVFPPKETLPGKEQLSGIDLDANLEN